jgi:SAM-dependent methyltransferase
LITFRRDLLDYALKQSIQYMQGHVLDVGGRKENKRGNFRPPIESVASWKYLNPDPTSKPDYLGTAENIPLPEGVIDTVVMTEVVEYFADCGRSMQEVFRILKPNGKCILTAPLVTAIHGDPLWDRQRFTKVHLMEIGSQAGFEIVEIKEMGSVGAVIFDLLMAAMGYAAASPSSFWLRIGRKLLTSTAPFFKLVDRQAINQQSFINTGYYMVLRKP